MHAMSLWSVRLAFGLTLAIAAVFVALSVFVRALEPDPREQDPGLTMALAAGFIGLALALRRGEAFAAWTLGLLAVVYGVKVASLRPDLLHMALAGALLGVAAWAALDLRRLGVQVPLSVDWARVVLYLTVLHAAHSAGSLLSDRPDVAANAGGLVFQTLLLTGLALGAWRRQPWAAYTLVGYHALGVVLSTRDPAVAAREAALLLLYAVGAYHVRKLARAAPRRPSLIERLSGRGR